MAGRKHKLNEQDILPKTELLLLINRLPNLRDRALMCFLYMSGARISEVLGTTKIIKHYIKVNNKFILDEKGNRKYDGEHSIPIRPLTKESVEYLVESNLLMIHSVVCLKHSSDVKVREIPIYVPIVNDFFDIFMEYYNKLKPGEKLFSITRQHAWRIIHKHTGLYNHFLIHERLSHLVAEQHFLDHDLKVFRGWSSTIPANSYVHLRWQEVAKKQGAKIDL